MTTISNAPALAAVAAWLAAPETGDTHVSVERWGRALELRADRGGWRLCINVEGATAGLELLGGDDGDMGHEWAGKLGELVELLNDPRVAAIIAAERRARSERWRRELPVEIAGGPDPDTPARIAATLAALSSPRPSPVRVERETIAPVVSADTPYDVVTLRYGDAGLSLAYDPEQPGAFDFAGPRGDTNAAELRELRAFLNSAEVSALIDAD